MNLIGFVAITLVAPWVQVLGTFGMSWAQAMGNTVAQLLGRGAVPRVIDAFLSGAWRAAFVAAGLVSLASLAFRLSSGWIYAQLQPQTRTALLTFLPVLLVLPFPKGTNANCGQTLRAAGDTVAMMNIIMAGQWLVKVPLTLVFVLVFDLNLAWVFSLFMFEEFFKFLLFHRRFYTGAWKRPRVDL